MSGRKSQQMSVTCERIGPDEARTLLATSPANRSMSGRQIATFADAIRRGEWALVGMITTDAMGRLRDGHHRLRAVIEAGTAVDFWIQRGVSESAVDKIDTGRHRTLADRLKILRPSATTPSHRAALTNTCARLLVGNSVVISSLDDYDRWYGLFRLGLDWVINLYVATKGIRSPVFGALAFAHKTDPDRVAAFGEKLVEHTGWAKGEPAWLLWKMLSDPQRATHYTSVSISRRVLRALLADLRREPIEKISDSVEGLNYFRAAYKGREVDDVLAPWRVYSLADMSERRGKPIRGTSAIILGCMNGHRSLPRAAIMAVCEKQGVGMQTARTVIGRLIKAGRLCRDGAKRLSLPAAT